MAADLDEAAGGHRPVPDPRPWKLVLLQSNHKDDFHLPARTQVIL